MTSCVRTCAMLIVLMAASGARADSAPVINDAPTDTSTGARLRQAEALAKSKELEAAADIYRSLLDEGRDGTGLRYNLGTLCLELGDLGCAVLHLRAAARMDPRDDDVQHNLGTALEARVDRLAGSVAVDPLRAFGAGVPPRAARAALAIPLGLLGLALGLLALGNERMRRVARVLVRIAASSAVAGGFVYACRLAAERSQEATVMVAETPALKDDDPNATVAFTAHAGLHGEVVGRSSDGQLIRLRFDNGLEAWLKESDTAR